jgi:hypothetical protein
MARMSKEERIEAEIVAARMLSCRARPRDVKKRLAEKFALSRGQASKVIKDVQQKWSEQAETTKADILAETFRTLNEATALAFTQQRPDHVVRVERLRAELAGLLGSELRLVAPPKDPDELEGKGELDVNAQAVFLKDWVELSASERGVVVQVLRERGDHELAADAESRIMN